MKMPLMGRVERTAQNADTHAWAMGAGKTSGEGDGLTGQGRDPELALGPNLAGAMNDVFIAGELFDPDRTAGM